MKINVTLLFVLMLLSSTVTMAQESISEINTETISTPSSETDTTSLVEETSYETETLQVLETASANNDKTTERRLQKNKIESDKARKERAKITDAVRKRLNKRNQTKVINNELLEERKKRAAFVEQNRVQENAKDLAKKEQKQNN